MMRNRLTLILMLLFGVVGAMSAPAAAHPYIMIFSGPVDVADGNFLWGPLWDQVADNDVWVLTIHVESDTPDSDGSASQGVYTGAITAATLEIEAASISTLVAPGTITVTDGGTDAYTIQIDFTDSGFTYPMIMQLTDSTETALSSDGLPLCDTLDLTLFDGSSFTLTEVGSEGSITGTVYPPDHLCDTDCNTNGQPDSLDSYIGGWFCLLGCTVPCSNGEEYSVALEWGGPTYTELNCPAVPVTGSTRDTMVVALAACIESAACPGVNIYVPSSPIPCFHLSVPLGPTTAPFLCVGAAGGPADCCVLPNGFACSYNPDLIAIAPSNRDCNDNLTDDAIDVALGTSPDENGDGVPDECDPPPTLAFNVTSSPVAGPPYPTADIEINVEGVNPPNDAIPVEILALSLQNAIGPPVKGPPVPMQLTATDAGGDEFFFGGSATVDFKWAGSVDAGDSFPDVVSYELLVELRPSGGNSPVGGIPPDDIIPSPNSFDVTFEVEVHQSVAPGSIATLLSLGTALHTLHFAIGPGQPLEFANVLVGLYDGSFVHPVFPISFDLVTTPVGALDPNAPLVIMTMEGEFIESSTVCGDGVISGTEVCDDGNVTDCDGCRGDCSAVETGCGDGFVCGGEVCDDGLTDACGSCNETCTGPGTGPCCEAPIVEAVGSRYLRIIPQPPGSGPQAIFITPDCVGGADGKYVGVPSPIDINGDNIFDEMVAGLVDDPLNAQFLTPAQWGELYVYGKDIVPETSYIVQGDCGSPGNPSLYAGTGATTWVWGDTNNDGLADFGDIGNIVAAFQSNFSQATLAGTDLTDAFDCVPNQIIDFDDIFAAVEAFQFQFQSYSDITCCAGPCPDVPPCSGNLSCDDGLFCNGAESCVAGQCLCGPDPCPGELCNELPDTCSASQVLTLVALPRRTIFLGQRVDLEIRVQNVSFLMGFQTTLQITRLSPGGGVSLGHQIGVPSVEGLADAGLSVLCPDGVAIETERSDYVFTGVENQKAEDCAGLRAGAVVIEAASADIGAAPAYLVTYTLDVRPDAEPGSTYEIALGPESFLLDSTGRRIPFSSGEPAILTIIANPIPTVSVWGVVLMSLLVLLAATLVLARRRVQPV